MKRAVTRAAPFLAVLLFTGACGRHPSSAAPEAGALASAAPTTSAPKSNESPADLTIFYSADLRGAGPREGAAKGALVARRATLADRARVASHFVLQVDAGDVVPAAGDRPDLDTPEKLAQRARLLFGAYQRMGVDVITLGERELAVPAGHLQKLAGVTDISVVATNVVDKKGEHPFPSDKLIEVGDAKVGVFGVLDPAPTAQASEARELATTDAAEAAAQAAVSLRSRGARLVIGLFHLAGGVQRAKEILARAGDVDIVVLGHGATGLTAPELLVGKTRIVHADASAGEVGRIDVRHFDGSGEPKLETQTFKIPETLPAHVGVELLFQLDTEPAKEPSAVGPDGRPIFENWMYGSNGACVLCHPRAVEQWKTTEHAHAMASLKKGGHEQDRTCIGCHTTGYLLPGGTRRVKTAIDQFADVGCECCHGPSVEHIRSVNKKKGTSRKVDPSICLGCHTIDRNGDLFDGATAMKDMLGPGHGAP
jgi:hypothetical protein